MAEKLTEAQRAIPNPGSLEQTMTALCPCCNQPLPPPAIRVDLATNTISYGDKRALLTPKQAEVAHCIAKAYPGTATRDKILYEVYAGEEPEHAYKTLDVFIHNIRNKLIAAELPIILHTVYGRGYQFLTSNGEIPCEQ